jgi:hypothetical protein
MGQPPTTTDPTEARLLADLRRLPVERQRRILLAALAEFGTGPPVQVGDRPVIWSIADRCYRVGAGLPVVVSTDEDEVLQAFVGRPAMDGKQLVRESRVQRAQRVLTALAAGHGGAFRGAIDLARHRGGTYRADVRLWEGPAL